MTTTKTTTTTTTTTNYENSNRRAEQNQQQSKRQENQQNKQVNNLREIDFFSNINIYTYKFLILLMQHLYLKRKRCSYLITFFILFGSGLKNFSAWEKK